MKERAQSEVGLAAGLLHLVTLFPKTGHPPASAIVFSTQGELREDLQCYCMEGVCVCVTAREGGGQCSYLRLSLAVERKSPKQEEFQ